MKSFVKRTKRIKQEGMPKVGQWYVQWEDTWKNLFYVLRTENDLANYVTAKGFIMSYSNRTSTWHEKITISMTGWHSGTLEYADINNFVDAIKYLFETVYEDPS
jgi:hypothetical protein